MEAKTYLQKLLKFHPRIYVDRVPHRGETKYLRITTIVDLGEVGLQIQDIGLTIARALDLPAVTTGAYQGCIRTKGDGYDIGWLICHHVMGEDFGLGVIRI